MAVRLKCPCSHSRGVAPMRLFTFSLCCLLVAAPSVRSQSTAEEREFLRARYEKKLLDPKTPEGEFLQTLERMDLLIIHITTSKPEEKVAQAKAFESLVRTTEEHKKAGDKRYLQALEHVRACAVIGYERIPDGLIPDFIAQA